MVVQIGAVALGGAVGCVARYLTTLGAARLLGTTFPFGTLLVNVIGCLLAGLVFGLFDNRAGLPSIVRILVLTGFLGGFTTFSSFALETVNFLQSGSYAVAIGSFVANNLVGGAFVLGGIFLGKAI
jgi:fluoride exporter